MLFRNWVWTRKSAADRPLGNLDMRTRMVAPCENSLRLTGRVMDAKSSLDHCAIPAEPPSLRFPRPAKRWTGDRWKAAQVCPLPEPARCPSLPVARACRGLRQAQPPKTYAAQACPLPEPSCCPNLSRASTSSATGNLRCPSLPVARAYLLPEPVEGFDKLSHRKLTLPVLASAPHHDFPARVSRAVASAPACKTCSAGRISQRKEM